MITGDEPQAERSAVEQMTVLQGFRLSVQQRRLWSLSAAETGQPYISRGTVRIEGPLDERLLRSAVADAVARHESLRTTFRYLPGMAVPLQVIAEAAVDWQASAEACTFDLERGPLLRAHLTASGPQSFLLTLTCPALCADAAGLALLAGEIATLYAAAHGEEGITADVMQYVDISEWQNEALDSADTEAARDRWRRLDLSGVAGLYLPGEAPAPGAFAPASRPLDLLPGEDLDRLGFRGEDVLLAAWQALLSRLTGHRDLVLGVVGDGRGYEELAGVIGPLTKVLPVPCRVEGTVPFSALVEANRTAVADALEGQELFAWEQLPAVDGFLPFCFEAGALPQPWPAGGVLLTVDGLESCCDRFRVRLRCWRHSGRLAAALDYDRSAFGAAEAERLAGSLLELLAAVVAWPDRAVGDLPVIAAAERQQLLVALNDTGADLPVAGLYEMFEAQARRSPQRVAVRAEESSVTYAELSARAGQLAETLARLGVGPEVPVAVHLDRSPELVVGLLAVLRAGGAYLPLDPGYPRDRLALTLEDACPAVVLTHSRWAASLPDAGIPTLFLDREGLAAEGPGSAALRPVDPDHPAYVIYTSGSTGRPKGVTVSHRAIANRLLWMQRDFPLTPDDRVLQKTPFTFDASIWEIFLPLFTGAEMVLARPGGHRDSAYLVSEIAARGITVLQLVPSHLRVFLDQPDVERCRSLRRVFCGGEALSLDLQRRFFSHLSADLHILYGPTEASIDVTSWHCEPGDEQPAIRIGRPIANTRIHLLDASFQLVPEGQIGELFISGAGLARGYLGRFDLTAERFLPDPFAAQPGLRLYRTGDLARWLPDGSLAFLGRVDHQVKVRGFRIELGEIEASLVDLSEVRAAVVLLTGDAMASHLAAFIVPAQGQQASAGALRERLRHKLPEHMVPATFTFVERFPLTANAKLDRAALAALEEVAEAAGAPARTPVEEMLTGLFAELLGRDRVGAGDDFFDLGGHSLLATQVVSQVRQVFRVELPLRSVFQAPTAAALAALVEQARQDGAAARLPPLVPSVRTGDAPLSYAQQRLWFLDQMAPGSAAFNIPTAVLLSGALDLGALEHGFREIVRRHEALRTVVDGSVEPPVQRVLARPAAGIPLVDLAGLPQTSRQAESLRLAEMEARLPFDLARGPLVRITALRTAERSHIVLLTLHHIIADGSSTRILVRELAALYGALLAGEAPQLPPPPLQYSDFAAWQRSWLAGDALDQEIAYWRSQLAGAPQLLTLPADRPRPRVPSGRGGQRSERLPEDLVAALAALVRRERVTQFMVLMAAFQVLLRWMTRQDDLVVGTDVASRNRAELEGVIGFFVNQLALRADLSGDPTFRELLSQVREAALSAYAHQDLPFDKLVDALNPERHLSHAPIFQVKVNYQEHPARDLEFPGLTWRLLPVESGRAQLDLILNLIRDEDGIEASMEYSTDLFEGDTISRALESYKDLLELVAEGGETRISALASLLSERDQQRRLTRQRERNASLRQGLSRGMRRIASAVEG
jgi:amino acid adenylation domain-containing protein